jgi:transcriptional regulator with XRE-family HTH domain
VDIRTLVVDDDQDSVDLVERILKKEGYRVGTLTDPRKKRTLTLKQLAKRTGLSVSLLSQIERAESSASVTSLYKIAHALKIRLPELFARV